MPEPDPPLLTPSSILDPSTAGWTPGGIRELDSVPKPPSPEKEPEPPTTTTFWDLAEKNELGTSLGADGAEKKDADPGPPAPAPAPPAPPALTMEERALKLKETASAAFSNKDYPMAEKRYTACLSIISSCPPPLPPSLALLRATVLGNQQQCAHLQSKPMSLPLLDDAVASLHPSPLPVAPSLLSSLAAGDFADLPSLLAPPSPSSLYHQALSSLHSSFGFPAVKIYLKALARRALHRSTSLPPLPLPGAAELLRALEDLVAG